MVEFLVSWAEQIIIAMIIIIMIEMIIPNSSYRKYIKIVLGIFIIYVIFSPLAKNNTNNIEIEKAISNQISSSNISQAKINVIDYNYQVENAYKERFKENITNILLEKGYEIKDINLDISYENENMITNKLNLKIKKKISNNNIKIDKIDISAKNEEENIEELNKLKQEISDIYDIDISKIFIESE